MSPRRNITAGDLASEAFNLACKHIQDSLGVATGDLAAQFFSSGNVEQEFIDYACAEIEALEPVRQLELSKRDALLLLGELPNDRSGRLQELHDRLMTVVRDIERETAAATPPPDAKDADESDFTCCPGCGTQVHESDATDDGYCTTCAVVNL